MTSIEYSVPSRANVTIEIFNILGQKMRTLVNESKPAGSYRIEWNGNDGTGRPVSTGVYLYRFSAGDVVLTKKMLLLK
jgi:flagellar hook assembly protein FlgD